MRMKMKMEGEIGWCLIRGQQIRLAEKQVRVTPTDKTAVPTTRSTISTRSTALVEHSGVGTGTGPPGFAGAVHHVEVAGFSLLVTTNS